MQMISFIGFGRQKGCQKIHTDSHLATIQQKNKTSFRPTAAGAGDNYILIVAWSFLVELILRTFLFQFFLSQCR